MVVAVLVPFVGSRDIAYQACLLLWLGPGLALLVACNSAEHDERQMEEAVLESINEGLVRGSKHRARQQVKSVLSSLDRRTGEQKSLSKEDDAAERKRPGSS